MDWEGSKKLSSAPQNRNRGCERAICGSLQMRIMRAAEREKNAAVGLLHDACMGESCKLYSFFIHLGVVEICFTPLLYVLSADACVPAWIRQIMQRANNNLQQHTIWPLALAFKERERE
jgi:hypothetical protein